MPPEKIRETLVFLCLHGDIERPVEWNELNCYEGQSITSIKFGPMVVGQAGPNLEN